MNADIVTATGLEKIYTAGDQQTPALRGVDLTVAAGELVAVMGPSGSGKTTLLNLLAGLDAPTSGTIALDGQDLGALAASQGRRRGGADALAAFRRRRLGFVFQDFNLLDALTLAENVQVPLLLDGRADARTAAVEALGLVGIADLADRFPDEVSGGQQQRAAVARALVHRPALVLADEPTGNLDTGATTALLDVLADLNAPGPTGEPGATIVMVTHDPRAASYASRVVLLRDGAVVAQRRRGGTRPAFFGEVLAALGELEG